VAAFAASVVGIFASGFATKPFSEPLEGFCSFPRRTGFPVVPSRASRAETPATESGGDAFSLEATIVAGLVSGRYGGVGFGWRGDAAGGVEGPSSVKDFSEDPLVVGGALVDRYSTREDASSLSIFSRTLRESSEPLSACSIERAGTRRREVCVEGNLGRKEEREAEA
jgi:hypothetical protein